MTAPATIVFDGGILGAGPPTGVARAFLHTLRAYVEQARDVAPLLLLPPHVESPSIDGLRELRTRMVVGPFARQFALPRLLRKLGARIFHAPIAAVPWRAPCAVIATVHDVPWRAADLPRESGHSWRHRLALRIAMRRAAVVLVPSRATLRDVQLECADADRHARLELVPHGVPLPPALTLGSVHDGPFLTLGDDRPRKNLARLAAAHALAVMRWPSLPGLVQIGPRGHAGFVSEADKHRRLRHARALVHVSLHEGFGLPVLEAMGHGTPVVCSDRSSLPELAGDAALLVDPTDVHAIADALVRIDTDLPLRARLSADGRARAACFLPEHSAAAWIRIHASLLA